jgi:hypothetical protein
MPWEHLYAIQKLLYFSFGQSNKKSNICHCTLCTKLGIVLLQPKLLQIVTKPDVRSTTAARWRLFSLNYGTWSIAFVIDVWFCGQDALLVKLGAPLLFPFLHLKFKIWIPSTYARLIKIGWLITWLKPTLPKDDSCPSLLLRLARVNTKACKSAGLS